MDGKIYIEIEDLQTMISLLMEAKKRTGLLKDVSPELVARYFSGKEFPVRIPVKADGILDIAANPIVRKIFGKKIEEKARILIKATAG